MLKAVNRIVDVLKLQLYLFSIKRPALSIVSSLNLRQVAHNKCVGKNASSPFSIWANLFFRPVRPSGKIASATIAKIKFICISFHER